MRGKDLQRLQAYAGRGITPAYAGKSGNNVGQFAESKDHPRVCGEKVVALGAVLFSKGSPPRMRGKVKWRSTAQSWARITPAYAGKRPVCLSDT